MTELTPDSPDGAETPDTPETPDNPYTIEQRQRILQIARQTITDVLFHRPLREPLLGEEDVFLNEMRGCFVTLHHRHGHLRGCIGTFEATAPLVSNIMRMALAATRDPRFLHANPVTAPELNDLHVEVSILTPMQPIEDPLSMRIGVDGIYIKGEQGGQPISGCFLPQVAPQQGWDAEATLSYCCAHKMGLEPESWRPPTELAFFVFQSIIIAESAPGVLE